MKYCNNIQVESSRSLWGTYRLYYSHVVDTHTSRNYKATARWLLATWLTGV